MDLAGFDLNLLKAFDALYAEQHVTHAGQRIGLSNSAMSGALTRLREVFAGDLFVRPRPACSRRRAPMILPFRCRRRFV